MTTIADTVVGTALCEKLIYYARIRKAMVTIELQDDYRGNRSQKDVCKEPQIEVRATGQTVWRLNCNHAALLTGRHEFETDASNSASDGCRGKQPNVVRKAGKHLDVEVLDHLVISAGKWMSMRELGLGWNT